MMKTTDKRIIRCCIVLLLLAAILWILWGNTAAEVTEYEIVSSKIPESFSGFRIAQISDLHNAEFGAGNSRLLTMLEEVNPDIILITGDLIDSRRTDMAIALSFVEAARDLAPVYYVTGNHEFRVAEYRKFLKGMEEAGAVVLRDEKVRIEREGAYITIAGIDDPIRRRGDDADGTRQVLSELSGDADGYTVLLSHRPELFSVYGESEIDLVFTGHAHGGQFRLPLLGGLVAPNQGLLPRYDAGEFRDGTTTMVVSRGLGNSVIPVRVFNRPEIVVAELKTNAQP